MRRQLEVLKTTLVVVTPDESRRALYRGALRMAGRQVFAILRRLQEELGVNTTCGASNISFGLPNRHLVTGTFLSMAICSGM